MADRKKIAKKTLAKAFHHWYYGHFDLFSLRTYANLRVPDFYASIVEEMYGFEQKDAMQAYTALLAARPNGPFCIGRIPH